MHPAMPAHELWLYAALMLQLESKLRTHAKGLATGQNKQLSPMDHIRECLKGGFTPLGVRRASDAVC